VKRVPQTVPEDVARKSGYKLDQTAPIATVEDLPNYNAMAEHGGQETTMFSLITNLLHFGMVVVVLPNSFQGQSRLDEVTGGAPYGAKTIAGGDGSRQPSC